MRKVVFLLWIIVSAAAVYGQRTTEGSLYAVGKSGKELGACPLKNTEVTVDISGFISRVSVKQEFVNSYSQAIEAVYMFPLSQNGAVDQMTMTVGTRVIRGRVMRREEARQTYEAAKTEGKTASLLDQERPNVFTQSVANIMPGEKVVIEISYIETLKYEDGAYEFVFPMTVAPRYVPADVRDAARISPPPARVRNGSNISIEVNLNAGVPVEQIRSSSHRIEQINYTPNKATVTLHDGKTIPNKDFILKYDVTGKRIEDAVLTHRNERGGFFTLILQPPDVVATEDRTPKEIVFVLDTSGSMDGFPIEKAKEAMKLSLDGLYPDDTFNLITFAGDTEILFEHPVPATRANLDRAHAFIAGRNGDGGTEMMAAIKASLEPSDSQEHLRIVCFMTDGQVGNEDEIVAEVKKHPKARVFSFGIGDSVNRSLLDRIAQEGKGEATYIALEDDGSKAARKFYERVRTPLLTDLSIDWDGMPVTDVYPNKLTDLFSAKPVLLNGRYTKAANGTIKLKGFVAGQPYERVIALNLPEKEAANDVLSTLWARTRIGEMSSKKLEESNSEATDALDKQMTDLGLEFGLMTEFTSFVAVEERVVNQNGRPVTVSVPVVSPDARDLTDVGDMPIRTGDVQSLKGGGSGGGRLKVQASLSRPPNVRAKKKADRWGDPNGKLASFSNGPGSGGGQGSGRGSGSGYGTGNGNGTGVGAGDNASPPPPTAATALSIQEVVTVTAEASVLNSTSSAISTRTITQLPLNGRSFMSLTSLTPGTMAGKGFQVDGASGSENTFIIDGTEVTNFRSADPSDPETDGLTGSLLYAARPVYTLAAKAAKAKGEVAVAIEVDAGGKVVSAKAVSGDPLLQKTAERAAMLSKFAPTNVGGTPIRITGTLAYIFENSKKVNVALREMKAAPLTEAEKRAFASRAKLHFWISDMLDRISRGVNKPVANEMRFVRAGSAEIQIDLTEKSPDTLLKLKSLGFVIDPKKGRSRVVGHIPVDKIAALADLDCVKLILPKI